MSDSPVVALVGHCIPDAAMLRRTVSRAIPGASVIDVRTEEQLLAALVEADLLLINRALDGSFAHTDGNEMIEALAARTSAKLMLVSNFEDAQARAVTAGAAMGFGKTALGEPTTRERLLAAVGEPG